MRKVLENEEKVMISRHSRLIKLTTRLFKPHASLPTPFASHVKPDNCQGTSTFAPSYLKSDSHQQHELCLLNIISYQNRLASVKEDFESFNVVEAQDAIKKIVSDLETEKTSYSTTLNQIISVMLDAYSYAGICFSKGGLEDKRHAINSFKNALNINPNHVISQIGLRNVELSFGIDEKGHPVARKF